MKQRNALCEQEVEVLNIIFGMKQNGVCWWKKRLGIEYGQM
jgi:hypothetical protein